MVGIAADDCIDAWKKGTEHILLSGIPDGGFVTEIRDPTPPPRTVLRAVDPAETFAAGAGLRRASDVAATIFPQRIWDGATSRTDLYRHYCATYVRGKRFPRNRSTWGSYFLRMIRYGPAAHNSLEDLIARMASWQTDHRAAFFIHTSDNSIDAFRAQSGPCLHYLQFECLSGGELNLSAIYRSHDYYRRALGNFIGLAQLLKFVAEEVGRRPHTIFCHSLYAHYDGPKRATRAHLGI